MKWRETAHGRLCVEAVELSSDGMHAEALDLLERALEIKPSDPKALVYRGSVFHALGRYHEAEQSLRDALEIDRSITHAWNELGMVMESIGLFERAASCFEQSAKISPNTSVLTMLASMQLAFDPQKSVHNAERALSIDPTWDEAQAVRDAAKRTMSEGESGEHFQRGLKAQAARRWELAAHEFRRTVELNPEHAKAYLELGCIIYRLEIGLDEARACLESSIRLDPSSANAQMWLAVILSRLERLGDSEAHFRMALGLTDDPAVVHSVFAEELLWHNSRYGDAERHFKAALGHDPDLVLALRDYARMLACHGRDAEAKQNFDRALEIDPDDRFTKRAYEEFLLELDDVGRNQDECLREAIAKDPNYTDGIQCLENRRK